MSLTLFTKFCSIVYHNLRFPRTHVHIQSRNFAKVEKNKKKDDKDKCPNKTCGEPKPKKSIWRIFGGAKGTEEDKICEEECAKKGCQPEPDLSEFGGTAYKTCGPAYIVQKELVEMPRDTSVQSDDKMVEKLERHPSLKNVEDPMPPFESVEQRMIKLCELGLHPAYKRYMSVPKQQPDLKLPKYPYKCRSGPIADHEYPAHLKLSKECLDRKNIFAEFKRAEPPRQLLAKMLEIKKNERPTLERKGPVVKGKDGMRKKNVK